MPKSNSTSDKAALRRKILGVRFRHARTRAGLNLKEVGNVLGLSVDEVTEIELGRRDVSLPQLEAMALICNVSVLFFWAEDGSEESKIDFPAQDAMVIRQRIIGALVRQARTEAGRTQDELANSLGIPTSQVSNYEYGKASIPVLELEALTEYLNVSLGYFMDEGITPNSPIDQTPSLDEITDYSQLPLEIREFLSNPANTLYIKIAMKLSRLSADTLRAMAEGLLEVTY